MNFVPSDPAAEAPPSAPADPLAVAFDYATVGLGVFDRDLRLIRVNRRLSELHGQPTAAQLGRRLSEFHPELAAESEARMERVLKTGAPMLGVSLSIAPPWGESARALVCDYHPLPVEADGWPGGVAVVVTDETDRVAADAKLAASEAELRNVLDAVAAFTGVLDADGVLLEANAPALAMAQLSPADVLGRRFEDTYWAAWSPETQANVRAAIAQAAQGQMTRRRERLRVAPERTVTVDLQFAPLRDAQGRVTRLVASAIDVTDLVEAQERQALLTAELNHRVKNILAVVGALVSQTAKRAASKEELTATLNGRIAAMAKAVATLSRSQWAGFGLAEVVQEHIEAYGSERFKLRGPELPIAPKAALGFALITYELVTNAAKYGALSKPEGYVTIDWTIENQKLDWRWREHAGPPADKPGESGFGSLLIRNIAEGDLGAAFTLDYAATGLEARIHAPLKRIQGMSAAEAAPRTKLADISGKRVLVVEDSAIIALEVASALEAAGVRVIGPAANVEEGMRLAETEALDAAIVDLDLQGRSSAPIAARLRKRGIAVLTMAAGVPEKMHPSRPFLAKPFTDPELIVAVSAALKAPAPG